jgi:hypothetical protein
MKPTNPTGQRWFQFGTRSLILATTCAAIFMAIVAGRVTWPATDNPNWNDVDTHEMRLWLVAPVLGAVAGLGFGGLIGHKMMGCLVGIAAAALLDRAVLVWFIITTLS